METDHAERVARLRAVAITFVAIALWLLFAFGLKYAMGPQPPDACPMGPHIDACILEKVRAQIRTAPR